MSSSNGKARAVEPIDDDAEQRTSGSEGSEDELGDPSIPEASTPSTSSNKKKKKRSKALKALNALKGGKDNIPKDLVNVVLEKVKETGQAPGADEATVRAALEQMKIKEVIQGKAGIGGKNKKETGGHKVCSLHATLHIEAHRLYS
jgi:glycylpeptide N-tetradecanoyltransferase